MYFGRSDPLRAAVNKPWPLIVVRIGANRGVIANHSRETRRYTSGCQYRNQRSAC
jgi:hypothetical protein